MASRGVGAGEDQFVVVEVVHEDDPVVLVVEAQDAGAGGEHMVGGWGILVCPDGLDCDGTDDGCQKCLRNDFIAFRGFSFALTGLAAIL